MRKALLAVAAVLFAVLGWLTLNPPLIQRPIDPAGIIQETGHAYTAPIASFDGWLRIFHLADDSRASAGEASNLVLLENGKALDGAHALHADIREKGAGRYSHWGTTLYLSASDNTDPRTNGRSYAYRAQAVLSLWLTLLLVALGLTAVAHAVPESAYIARRLLLTPADLRFSPIMIAVVALSLLAIAVGFMSSLWRLGTSDGYSLAMFFPVSDGKSHFQLLSAAG